MSKLSDIPGVVLAVIYGELRLTGPTSRLVGKAGHGAWHSLARVSRVFKEVPLVQVSFKFPLRDDGLLRLRICGTEGSYLPALTAVFSFTATLGFPPLRGRLNWRLA